MAGLKRSMAWLYFDFRCDCFVTTLLQTAVWEEWAAEKRPQHVRVHQDRRYLATDLTRAS
jgi:hypothetical protein